MTTEGLPVTREALAGGGILVAFPEGHTDAADSQVALLHLVGDRLAQPGRESWSPEGFVAYSRVCTHAGCAVAQYEDEAQRLLCPCHQSTFDLLNGASPSAAPPAARCPSCRWPSTPTATSCPERLRRARRPRLLEPL